MVSFHSRFSVLWVGRRNERIERAISVLAEQCSLDEPEELEIAQFSQEKKTVK